VVAGFAAHWAETVPVAASATNASTNRETITFFCVLDAEDALATHLTATAAAVVTTAGITTTADGIQTGVQAGIA
jgi:hypothetical protein